MKEIARFEQLLKNAEEAVRQAIHEKQPMLLRYNNDTDGVTGALALARALRKLGAKFLERENNSAIYSVEDARKDIDEMRRLGDSFLFILIDFGANGESIEALELVRSASASLLIIDHHPHDKRAEGLAGCLVSPWVVGLDSHYAAGFLAAEFAKRIAGIDVKELQLLSLLGDRSRLLPEKEKTKERQIISQAIDYVASYGRLEQTLVHYEKIVSDFEYASKLYLQAADKLGAARKTAAAVSRIRRIGQWDVQLVKVDKAVKPGEFPAKGKLVGLLNDELAVKVNGPAISIGCGERYITFRANEPAKEAGFDANRLIQQLKVELPDALESGGGHARAASLKVKTGFSQIVLDEVLKKISEMEGSAPAHHAEK